MVFTDERGAGRAGPVLLVDDHEDPCALATAVLEREGHRTICAADGRTALRAFFEVRPSLVILPNDPATPMASAVMASLDQFFM